MAVSRTAWDADDAQRLIQARTSLKGAMLPILHELQEVFGYIDSEAVSMVSEALNVSKAETLGVISFYSDFRQQPLHEPLIKLCRAESCQAAGCEELVRHLADRHKLQVDAGEGEGLAVETVYCLGHCAASPAAVVDGKPVARLDVEKLDKIISALRTNAQ